MKFQAVIFDFDGLMVDTEWAAFTAWSDIYQEYGQTLDLSQWVLCVGSGYHLFDPVENLSRLAGKDLERSRLIQDKERRKAAFSEQMGLMAGVLERILQAQSLGLKLGLASSSFRETITKHCRRLGVMESFQASVTGDEVPHIKPQPDLYLCCAEKLGVDPSRCLVFEDSLNGVKAAKAAGMSCFAIPNRVTAGLDFALADRVAASLLEVDLARELGLS